MNRVPAEVLHEIFIKLSLEDRIKCLSVCRRWYNTLDKRGLLCNLDITTQQYSKLKGMVERFPNRAAQMEYLTVWNDSGPNFDKRELCSMFPNLRELLLKQCNQNHRRMSFDHETNYMSRPFHFKYPTSKLVKIEDYGDCELTCQLIVSNLCNSLKSLELSLKNSTEAVRSSVTTQLTNMPVLEHLSLIEPRATLMDLETLHRSVPSIKSLHLKHVSILTGEIPHDVIPATLITKLDLNFGVTEDDRNTHVQFYKYIYNKYPSVKKPNINDSSLLHEYIEYVEEVYNEGIFPIYQRVGPQLETFVFNSYYNGLDVFRRFDDFGISFRNLTIQTYCEDDILSLRELGQSQQSQSITTLILKNIIPKPMYLMSNMRVLTHLEISTSYDRENQDNSRRTLDFCELVRVCPATLYQLKLSGLELEYDKGALNQTSIECLDLRHINLEQSLASAIETGFPKLAQLRFDGEIIDQVTIRLPKNNLDILYIKVYYDEIEDNGFIITTRNDAEYYAIRPYADDDGKGTIRCYGKVTRVPKKKFHYNPALSLTCASCKKSSFHIGHSYVHYL